jgi:hypothetical protein
MGQVGPFRILVTATVVVAGCGGETVDRISTGHSPPTNVSQDAGSDGGVVPPLPAEFERPSSGTRLTVIEPYSPDRPILWDQEKNTRCRPQLATDGTMRCLPDSGYAVMFADSRCTHGVIIDTEDACGGSLKYYVDGDGGGTCGSGMTTVYTAGARLDRPQELYPHNANPCSLLDLTVQQESPGPYYEAVPSDPAEWVAFTEEVVPVTDALAVTVWIGADGSRLPHGLKLLPSKTSCDAYPRPQEPAAPRTWCIPMARARPGDGFPTDQCSGERLAGACGPTDVIELSPSGQNLDLLETGEVVSTVYFANPNEGGKCMTFPPAWTSAPNTTVFYRNGPPLPLERYPTLTVSRQGSGRVQVEYLTSGGKNLFVESYFDTKYGQRCTPTELSSGGTWCVPAEIGFTQDLVYGPYADPGCTRPLASADPGQGTQPFALVYPSGHSCTSWALPTLHSVLEYRGPTFEKSAGSCVPSLPPPLPPLPRPSPQPPLWLEPGSPIDPAEVLGAVPQ